MTRTRLALIAGLGVLGVCGLTNAQIVFEVEPNNTQATAQPLPGAEFPGAELVTGAIGPDGTTGGIDFFSFPVAVSGYSVLLSLFDSTSTAADSRIGLFSPSGTLIAQASSSGPVNINSGPLTTTGTYRVAVTGAADTAFTGNGHSNVFQYNLLVGVAVPAPGAAAIIGLAGVISLRRRR